MTHEFRQAEARLVAPYQSVSTLSTLNRQGLEALEQVCGDWLAAG